MSKKVRVAGLTALALLLLIILSAAFLVDPSATRRADFAVLAKEYSTDPVKLKPLAVDSRVKAVHADGHVVASMQGSILLIQQKATQIDTRQTYKIRARFRVLANDPKQKGSRIYVGLATYDSNDKLLTSGVGAHRYAASLGKIFPSGEWTEVEGTISGVGDGKHSEFRPGTVFVRPVALLNYQSAAAETELDWMKIEQIAN